MQICSRIAAGDMAQLWNAGQQQKQTCSYKLEESSFCDNILFGRYQVDGRYQVEIRQTDLLLFGRYEGIYYLVDIRATKYFSIRVFAPQTQAEQQFNG